MKLSEPATREQAGPSYARSLSIITRFRGFGGLLSDLHALKPKASADIGKSWKIVFENPPNRQLHSHFGSSFRCLFCSNGSDWHFSALSAIGICIVFVVVNASYDCLPIRNVSEVGIASHDDSWIITSKPITE